MGKGKGEIERKVVRKPRISKGKDEGKEKGVVFPDPTDLSESFYSQFMTPEQQIRFAQILRSPELLKLDTEIARLKVLASNMSVEDLLEKNVKLVISVHDTIGRLVATRHKMLYGDKHSVNVQSINIIMVKMVQIIEKHVVNPVVRQAIAEDLAKVDLGE